ncbi:MAG: SIMPL domain-containing protein [Vampirovibrionales bacterium]|nr:SIMPL domain-containing protein [Vampirovibrionales bacterium]
MALPEHEISQEPSKNWLCQLKNRWAAQNTTGLIAALGLVIAAAIVANSMVYIKTATSHVMTVTGSTSQVVDSDWATWTGNVAAEAPTRQAAYAKTQHDVGQLKIFLKNYKLHKDAFQVVRYDVIPQYARFSNGNEDTSNILAYRVNAEFKLGTPAVDQVEALSRDSGELLAKGIQVNVYSTQYMLKGLDELKIPLLGKAIENAKQRAVHMAKQTGNGVGGIQSASMGVFQITSPDSTEVSDYGMSDTSTRSKKVTAVVNVTFELR